MWIYTPVRTFIAWCVGNHRDDFFFHLSLKVWTVPWLFSKFKDSGSIWGQTVWDFWRRVQHWDRLSAGYFQLSPANYHSTGAPSQLPSAEVQGRGGGYLCNVPLEPSDSLCHPASNTRNKTECRTSSPVATNFRTTSCVIGGNWMWRRCCVVASSSCSLHTLDSSWFLVPVYHPAPDQYIRFNVRSFSLHFTL
jgi:hypothetical protein